MAIPEAPYFEIKAKADGGKIDGQVKKPVYWIEVTSGMGGYFAVRLWDGMGYPEPWDAGFGRYATHEEAEEEARNWAECEELEYRS